MIAPLLSTKFYIPQPRKNIVKRQHLLDQVEECLHMKLLLVSAPAGYGKTMLIASWLAGQELPKAWISADAGDNDFYRFFNYLLEALNRSCPPVGETLLQLFRSGMPPSQDNLVTLFLNELSTLAADCILVIDDYHLIRNPAIHSAFHQIIQDAPRHIHFIVCSRTELPFSVSKLRSHADLLELSQKGLSLTLEESARYMNLVMGSGLSDSDVAILHDRTEGWLAGLQLAALSLRDQADPARFIRSLKGNHRFIADYLVDEVLSRIPEDLQDFLLRTSVLSQMEASLCNFVLQIEDSQELLVSLDKKRLFTIPLDDSRQWFRYHHLFSEMLFARLLQRSPEIVAGLYQRASAWHAEHGMPEDAVDYALDGNDYAQATRLIKKIGLPLLSHGGWNRLLNWYDRIPEAEFHKQPDFWLIYFMTLINTGLIVDAAKKIEEIFARDFKTLDLPENELTRVRGELAAAQGVIILHSRADPLLAKESLEVARGCLAGDLTFRSAFANNNYGITCMLLGQMEEAREIFEKNIAWGKKNELSQSRVMGTSYLAETMAITGNLQRADELFQETAQYVHKAGLQEGAVFSKTNLGLGALYYEWNKLDLALKYLTEGIRLAELGGYLNQLLPGWAALARIRILQGDFGGVQETIQRARIFSERYGDPPAAVSFINAIEAYTAQQRGVGLIVDNWLAYRQNASSDTTNYFSQYEVITHARILVAREDFPVACEVIKPMWELALRQGRMKDAISCEVIMARCLFMKGEPLPAKTLLQQALFKAEPNHFVRSFLDEGGVVISMIKQFLASESSRKQDAEECSTTYLYSLLDEAGKDSLKASTSRPMSGGVGGLEPLTDQELNILHMLESGYQNKQIAQGLNISLNTVKYHLKNIYGKLGVVNRTQAARIVRNEEIK
jgi:ATP/maltotriose-dependent transcriptional regulator MalT